MNMDEKERVYPLWTELPYAGESNPPSNPVEPGACLWRTYFFQKNEYGGFKTLDRQLIKFTLKDPNTVNWNEQLEKVQQTLINLTKKEIQIAKYWAAGPPSKQWIPIVNKLIEVYNVSGPRAARIIAAFHSSINDALVVTWCYKYKWLVPRPNQLDQNLATVVCTPKHPAYPSGHAAVAGAAEVVLSYFFPAERSKIQQIAKENMMSRLYAGVHFPVDNEVGLCLGRQVGRIAVYELEKERDSKGQQVDAPYTEFRNAKIIPIPYESVKRYTFREACESQVIENPNFDTIPRAKLFI